MTNCTQESFYFPPLHGRKIEAKFSGGDVTSDGDVLLLREIDNRLNLINELSAVIPDPRNPF